MKLFLSYRVSTVSCMWFYKYLLNELMDWINTSHLPGICESEILHKDVLMEA
jgi:hypothetical protein